MTAHRLDHEDRVLLDELQRDARQSLDALAGRVALSAPAVQRRIHRLRRARVITGEVAPVDPAAVGAGMAFIVLVERERGEQIDAFRRKVIGEPQVQQGDYVTGEADFVVVALAGDMEGFEALTRRLFFDDPNVRHLCTCVAMGAAHRTLAVPAVHAAPAGD